MRPREPLHAPSICSAPLRYISALADASRSRVAPTPGRVLPTLDDTLPFATSDWYAAAEDWARSQRDPEWHPEAQREQAAAEESLDRTVSAAREVLWSLTSRIECDRSVLSTLYGVDV